MKLSHYTIIFLIVIASFITIDNYKIKELESYLEQNIYLTRLIDNACDDASNASLEVCENSNTPAKYVLDPMRIIDTFFYSLKFGLGMQNDEQFQILKLYFPFILILDDDGYYIYALKNISDGSDSVIKHILSPKQYFSLIDHNKIYRLYCSGAVEVLQGFKENSQASVEPVKSTFGTVNTILEKDVDKELEFLWKPDIENEIKRIIASQIQAGLERAIIDYQQMIGEFGILYNSDIEDSFDIDAIIKAQRSVFVYIRAFPLTNNKSFQYSSLRTINMSKRDLLYGFELNGILYWAKSDDPLFNKVEVKAIFLSEKEAAAEGYYQYRK